MSTITFDTLKFVEKLKSAGVPEAHAKAEAEALVSAFAEAMDAQLATKTDISDLKTEIVALKGEVGSIKWMMGALIAIANFAKQFF